jgi:hypothetical protein
MAKPKQPAGPATTLGNMRDAQPAIHISATNSTDAPNMHTIRV